MQCAIKICNFELQKLSEELQCDYNKVKGAKLSLCYF